MTDDSHRAAAAKPPGGASAQAAAAPPYVPQRCDAAEIAALYVGEDASLDDYAEARDRLGERGVAWVRVPTSRQRLGDVGVHIGRVVHWYRPEGVPIEQDPPGCPSWADMWRDVPPSKPQGELFTGDEDTPLPF